MSINYKPKGYHDVTAYLVVTNAESTIEFAQKVFDAGAKSIMVSQDKFYGDRNAAVEDSCGNQWWIATHRENLTQEQLEARMEEVQHA